MVRTTRRRYVTRRTFLASAVASAAVLAGLRAVHEGRGDVSSQDLSGIRVASAAGVTPSAVNGWTRAGMKGMNSAAYLTLQSGGDEDALVGTQSEVADATEVHRSFMDGTVMRMEPAGPLVIPAGGSVELAPGGYHIMLIGLKTDLMAGSEMTLTLLFEQSDPLVLVLPVRPMGGMGSH